MRLCSVDGCDRIVRMNGLCNMHDIRLRRTGRLDLRSTAERFWSKVNKTDGCWHWVGTFYSNGYGSFSVGQKRQMAHRQAYELDVGPIPEGFEVDHLCRNRSCVNPAHLEPVTHRTNVLRGMAPSAVAHRSNLCAEGHQFTEENTYVDPRGRRNCRTCKNAAWRARYHREASRPKEGIA